MSFPPSEQTTTTETLLNIDDLKKEIKSRTGLKCRIVLLDAFTALLETLSLHELYEVFERSCPHLKERQDNEDEKNLLTIYCLMAVAAGNPIYTIGAFFKEHDLMKMVYIIEEGKHLLSTDPAFFEFYSAMKSEVIDYWGK